VLINPFTGVEIGSALLRSFTTASSGTMTTLDTPTDAAVFGGYNPVLGVAEPGTYGLQVVGVFGPPDMAIVFEEAVETGVGTGTPGAYGIVSIMAAVVGDVTRFIASAPNDGKLRWLRAYATATGYTDSSPTMPESVDPWGATVVPVGQNASTLLATRSLHPRTDLTALRDSALQSFLGLSTPAATLDVDDADLIVASRTFGT
jgi:hypothetical protein